MKKVAVILCGCGHLDGSEIRESVLCLLELDRAGAEVEIFAPDRPQVDVVNHLTQKPVEATRNCLEEAARTARGKVKNLDLLDPLHFDAVVFPGGFGALKNFSTMAVEGAKGKIDPKVAQLIRMFHQAKKPIGAVCIAPALVAAVLKDSNPQLTLGRDSGMLSEIGVDNNPVDSSEVVFDRENKLVSTPAYMHADKLTNIHQGIAKMVKQLMEVA